MGSARESIVAKHVLISGLVQGIGYRAWTVRRASGLGLSGWVRNRRSGEVEAVFSGRTGAVEAMLAACRQGPSGSAVREVAVLGDVDPVEGPFEQRGTV